MNDIPLPKSDNTTATGCLVCHPTENGESDPNGISSRAEVAGIPKVVKSSYLVTAEVELDTHSPRSFTTHSHE
jgi:hypothetical protein